MGLYEREWRCGSRQRLRFQKRQGNREKNRGTKVGNRVEWERVSGHKDSSEEGVGYIKGAVQSAS